MITYPTKFYDGTDSRKLVDCPDCGTAADLVVGGGDHGGVCTTVHVPRRRALSGVEIIRRYALTHRFLSVNEIRAELDEHGVAENARGPAFAAACKAGHIRASGALPSTGGRTKGHRVQTYTSLICGSAVQQQETA